MKKNKKQLLKGTMYTCGLIAVAIELFVGKRIPDYSWLCDTSAVLSVICAGCALMYVCKQLCEIANQNDCCEKGE